MHSILKEDLESIVKNFEKNLNDIKVENFESPQYFANSCTDLLNNYISKLNLSVMTLSTAETYRKDYIPSFEYRRRCQRLLEIYFEENL